MVKKHSLRTQCDRFVLILDGRCLRDQDTLSNTVHTVLSQVPTAHPKPIIIGTTPPSQIPSEWQGCGIKIEQLSQTLGALNPDWVGYIPLNEEKLPDPLPFPEISVQVNGSFIAPWIPSFPFPVETAKLVQKPIVTWIATADLVQSVLAETPLDAPWNILSLAESLEQRNIPFSWHTVTETTIPEDFGFTLEGRGQRPLTSTVLAVIPYYNCEPWLRRCLTSLLNQSRKPDGIVVINDASPSPPHDIVAEFPDVTLLTSTENVGPYRLIQQVIEQTQYDYYLFQDADDWSSADRLEKLLLMAQKTSADLIGTQEVRVESATESLFAVTYPLDANQALIEKPGHPLLHSTSLVRRRLVLDLGGFATGLRFGGDSEFLLRAARVGRVVNLPDYSYFRQRRPNSLTTAPTTGLDSPARQTLLYQIKQRARENRAAIHQGKPPNLKPLCQSDPILLQHQLGPVLRKVQ